MRKLDLITAKAKTFRELVGTRFEVHNLTGDFLISVTLDSVEKSKKSYKRDSPVIIGDIEIPPRRPFSLAWIGPKDPLLGQGTYILRNSETDDFEVFLSPYGQDHNATFYESLFT